MKLLNDLTKARAGFMGARVMRHETSVHTTKAVNLVAYRTFCITST